jgi:hypothetical protein
MKQLPNGLTIFNATPHVLTFWAEGWDAPIEAEPDYMINATLKEQGATAPDSFRYTLYQVDFVQSTAVGNVDGQAVIEAAIKAGADLIVGSILAAQAYPGQIVAGVACQGFERVPPAEKRIRHDKFVVFES